MKGEGSERKEGYRMKGKGKGRWYWWLSIERNIWSLYKGQNLNTSEVCRSEAIEHVVLREGKDIDNCPLKGKCKVNMGIHLYI